MAIDEWQGQICIAFAAHKVMEACISHLKLKRAGGRVAKRHSAAESHILAVAQVMEARISHLN